VLYDFADSCRYSQLAMNELKHTSAFVVQFRADADPARGKLAGRVEHVASGRTANFQSVDDLPELLRRMLHDARQRDQRST
jgi:hypothetical protein